MLPDAKTIWNSSKLTSPRLHSVSLLVRDHFEEHQDRWVLHGVAPKNLHVSSANPQLHHSTSSKSTAGATNASTAAAQTSIGLFNPTKIFKDTVVAYTQRRSAPRPLSNARCRAANGLRVRDLPSKYNWRRRMRDSQGVRVRIVDKELASTGVLLQLLEQLQKPLKSKQAPVYLY